MAFTHALATNKYGESKLIVATDAAYGTHTTLASAMADAVSGDTIFLRDSVTENVTITAGVNITAWSGGTLNTPTITGTLTMTAAGTSTISGLRLVTNAAALIAVTGSAASILNLMNCYLSMGSDAITFSSSSASARINLFNCMGDLTTTAIKVFSHSSAGTMLLNGCLFTNTGASTTANTLSAGTLNLFYSQLSNPITTSGSTAAYASTKSIINCNTLNATALTHGCTLGTASASSDTTYSSGTAVAVSISVNALLNMVDDQIGSNNATPVAGAGTVTYTNLSFFGTGQGVYTTNQIGGAIIGLKGVIVPSAGFIGEEVAATASAVALVSTTAKTVTSIALTPGVWDISCIAAIVPTGGTLVAQAFIVNISTTTNTITGTLGQDYWQYNNGNNFATIAGSVPSLRKTITANTTYYLVCQANYTSTSCPANGRIKATRVG